MTALALPCPPPHLLPLLEAHEAGDASVVGLVADTHEDEGIESQFWYDYLWRHHQGKGPVSAWTNHEVKSPEAIRHMLKTIDCTLEWWLDNKWLALWHPLEKVTIRDRSPRPSDGHGRASPELAVRWGWFTGRHTGMRDEEDVPDEIFLALTGNDVIGGNDWRSWRWYSSMKAATDALSAALIRMARKPKISEDAT